LSFFINHPSTAAIYPLSLHDALPISHSGMAGGADCILVPERKFSLDEVCSLIRKRIDRGREFAIVVVAEGAAPDENHQPITKGRSEEHTSELQSRGHLVCRLLLEKKK